MYRAGINVKVLVNGRSVKEHSHQNVTMIESRHGTAYTIKIGNDNPYRVMTVVSVDGLDVISGKPAEETNKGYIVDSYSSTEIKGYRISDTDSAAFVFTSKGKSYVAKSKDGNARNSGVIGVRVFREKEKPAPPPTTVVHHHYPKYVYPWNPWNSGGYYPPSSVWTSVTGPFPGESTACGTSTSAGSSITYTVNSGMSAASHNTTMDCATNLGGCHGSSGPQGMTGQPGLMRSVVNASNAFDSPISYKDFDSGTTWGKKQEDKVKREYFERGALLTELVLYYATKEALSKMGIEFRDEPRIAEEPMPQAFGGKYCQPPKDWQG